MEKYTTFKNWKTQSCWDGISPQTDVQIQYEAYQNLCCREFPGGPMVKTRYFHCWGLGSARVGELGSHSWAVPPKKKISGLSLFCVWVFYSQEFISYASIDYSMWVYYKVKLETNYVKY